MRDWFFQHEPALRLGTFLGILAIMAVWEIVAARRDLSQPRRIRWWANLGLAVVDSFVVRLLFPAAAVGIALVAEQKGWGVLHQIEIPYWLALVGSFFLLDLAIYLQHVMFHAVPLLWRFHMVHHADQDFDFTTGIRFHPIEILLSVVIKFTVIVALGPPPEAVFLFAVVLNATAMFNHGNVRMPAQLDQVLRWLVVTPDMHRVHHSVVVRESNSNFGFNLPWWDRLFGTYRDQPAAGHTEMVLGVDHLFTDRPRGLGRVLVLPFTGRTGRYPISTRIGDTAESGDPEAPR